MRTEPDTRALGRGLRLEYLTLAWNAAEAAVGIFAGLSARSIALVGFGLDSVIEGSSASVLVWRLRAEARGRHDVDQTERLAIRAVAVAFAALALYVGVRAGIDLAGGSRPETSSVGIVLAITSAVGMPFLARRKRRLARELGSHALHVDSRQTVLCALLSVALLLGLGANALFGWWWADPTAGLVIAAFAAREAYIHWTTENPQCC
jgi:divalent metal cation (Fe/Co/Zn/Cd) transporter